VRERLRLMSMIALFAIVLVSVGCATSEEPAEEPTAAEEPEAEPAATTSILADPTRPEDEVAQDGGRKALDAYAFFGVEPGMTVADVWTGAGYNTHLLSRTVTDGKVFAILGLYAEGQFAQADALAQRVTDAELDNVEIVTAITDVPADSLDVAIMVRNFHDADAYGDGRPATVAQLFAITKPGGIVGIIDVATPHEGWHEDTHRLNEQAVIDDFVGGGFELVDSSDMLRNPDDDHSATGFQEGRHTVDRYVLQFRKPAGN
jgi:predicted methyltransferase